MLHLDKINDLIPKPIKDYTPLVLISIGGFWIITKIGSKVLANLSQKWMLARWSNTPRDVVIVHSFGAAKTAPDASPYPIKLETFLRMAKIPYEIDTKDCMSVKQKCPWISLNGEHIADSQICVEFLAKKFNIKIGNYSEQEKAIGTITRIMMDEHFYWGLLTWRYIFTKGRDCHKIFDINPTLMNFFLYLWKPIIEKACWGQGIGRHSEEEVIKIMLDDLKALSLFLGKKKFLLGDQPCEEDAAVFGQLAQVLFCCPDSPYEKAINGELKNLKEYVIRMKETFWPDWDERLAGGKVENKNK